MNDKIIEKLAYARLLLSFSFISIAGLMGWVYNLYKENDSIEIKLGIILLLFFSFIFFILIIKINSLIKKLK